MNKHIELELRLAGLIVVLDNAPGRKLKLHELRKRYPRKDFATILQHGVKRGLIRQYKGFRYAYVGPPCNGYTVDAQAVVIATRTDEDMDMLAYYGIPKRLTDAERRAQANEAAHRRRARALNAYIEPVSRTEIFERDGWTCQLCFDPIEPALRFPHPLSASIDHTVPLARGGIHAPRNVQAAHLNCNVKKGARA